MERSAGPISVFVAELHIMSSVDQTSCEVDEVGSAWLPLWDLVRDGLLVVAREPWRIVYANSTSAAWLGKRREALCGQPLAEIVGPDAERVLLPLLEDVWQESAPSARATLSRIPGTTRPLVAVLRRVPLGEAGAVAILLQGGAPRPHYHPPNAARADALTGLPDRSVVLERISALQYGERSADRRFAVLFIDLDNFKQVNDAHGHLVGDRALREVARRLAGCVRAGDMIGRFGGDEFVALVEEIAAWEEIESVVERIHAALAEPIALPEGEVTLTASIGVAQASAAQQTADELLEEADRAMYASKRGSA